MTTYVDASALVKLYVDEPDSDLALELVSADPVLATSWLTVVEVRRNLARVLDGPALARARELAEDDFERMAMIDPVETTWRSAAEIAEHLGVRSLDAIHLATAQGLRIPTLSFCTFDLRQGQAARQLGLHVVGC